MYGENVMPGIWSHFVVFKTSAWSIITVTTSLYESTTLPPKVPSISKPGPFQSWSRLRHETVLSWHEPEKEAELCLMAVQAHDLWTTCRQGEVCNLVGCLQTVRAGGLNTPQPTTTKHFVLAFVCWSKCTACWNTSVLFSVGYTGLSVKAEGTPTPCTSPIHPHPHTHTEIPFQLPRYTLGQTRVLTSKSSTGFIFSWVISATDRPDCLLTWLSHKGKVQDQHFSVLGDHELLTPALGYLSPNNHLGLHSPTTKWSN